jgi:hypothetical protein
VESTEQLQLLSETCDEQHIACLVGGQHKADLPSLSRGKQLASYCGRGMGDGVWQD